MISKTLASSQCVIFKSSIVVCLVMFISHYELAYTQYPFNFVTRFLGFFYGEYTTERKIEIIG